MPTLTAILSLWSKARRIDSDSKEIKKPEPGSGFFLHLELLLTLPAAAEMPGPVATPTQ